MNGKQVTIIIGIFSALIFVILYGIEYRPIVGYSLNEDDIHKEIDSSYKPNLFQDYNLQIKNSGKTDAPLILHFFCNNATISDKTKKPYHYINESEVSIYLTISKDFPQYYSGDKSIAAIEINKDVRSFACEYEVLINRNDNSISGLINRFFGEIKGYYPKSFKYVRINDKFILQE